MTWDRWVELSLSAFIALMAMLTYWNVHVIHLIVNSRLDELVKATGARERAAGREEQRAEHEKREK